MSQKINLSTLREQAQKTEDKYVEKSISWNVDVDGEIETFSGTVDILVVGQRSWGKAKETMLRMSAAEKEGKAVDPLLIVEMVSFDGEHPDYELVDSMPASLFWALIDVVKEVNPSLFEKKDTAGKS